MAGQPAVDLTVDQQQLRDLTRALRREADGKELRRDLIKALQPVAEPAKDRAVSQLMATGHAGLPTAGEPLRASIARKLKVSVRLSGRAPGVTVQQGRTPGVRGFRLAGRAMNARRGWRHPVYGRRGTWVQQRTTPAGWFDDAMKDSRRAARQAVVGVMRDMAQRIARRAR